jgi:hypothetical protein
VEGAAADVIAVTVLVFVITAAKSTHAAQTGTPA